MNLNFLFKQYFCLLAVVVSAGIHVPIVLSKSKWIPKITRFDLAPSVYERDGCSRRFFSNVEMGHGFKFWEIGEEKFKNVKAKLPEDKGNGEVMGCLLAKSADGSSSEKRYVFFEMAMMNERVGWSIWADSYEKGPNDSSTYIDWEYKLFLLHKENGANWKVSGGYHWKDKNFPEGNKEIYIDLPGKTNWVSRKIAEGSTGVVQEKDSIFQHSFMWKEDQSKDKEIFEPIRVGSTKEGTSEIFGSKGNFKDGESEKGYSQISDFYHTDGNGWGVHRKGNEKQGKEFATVDIGGTLSQWYEPFSGKHGHWVPFEEYCKDNGNRGKEGYVRGCKMVKVWGRLDWGDIKRINL